MLNASRHHRPGSPERQRQRAGREDVLNASRHHRPGSRKPSASVESVWSCAQRLAASPPRVTLKRDARASNGCDVLNASRHHRPGSPASSGESAGQRILCSTPRGITAPGHLLLVAFVAGSAACSTPRGITAPGHRGREGGTMSDERCSTPRGITAPGHFIRHHSLHSSRSVLNASRHHRPGSPSAARCSRASAQRAQRLAASPPRVTPPGAHRPHRCHVLNASRHHRPGSLAGLLCVVSPWNVCSTPRGITAPGHLQRFAERCSAGARAQRLAASPPRVTAAPNDFVELGTSCSTPRGITAPGHSTRRCNSPTAPRRCAQRLAASPPRVTRTTSGGGVLATGCSTPRGITAPGHA